MAKTKPAKQRARRQRVTLRFISDPGHGWLEVPKALCKQLRLGTDFAHRGDFFYLEEDCECDAFERAAKRHGVSFITPEHDVDSFDHWLGGEQWPYIPAALYGEDSTLVCAALEFFGTHMKQCSLDGTCTAQERSAFRQTWEDCARLTEKLATMKGVGGE